MSDTDATRIGRVKAAIIAVVAAAVGLAVRGGIDVSLTHLRLEDAKKNHAMFEGTWTPHEIALERAGRELERYNRARENHALAEGSEVRAVA